MILRESISIKQAAKRESQFHCRISGEVIDKFIKKTLTNWISLQSRFAQIRFFILNSFFLFHRLRFRHNVRQFCILFNASFSHRALNTL